MSCGEPTRAFDFVESRLAWDSEAALAGDACDLIGRWLEEVDPLRLGKRPARLAKRAVLTGECPQHRAIAFGSAGGAGIFRRVLPRRGGIGAGQFRDRSTSAFFAI